MTDTTDRTISELERKFNALKSRADRLETESARAEGVLSAAMTTLKEKFGVTSIAAARGKLSELEAEAREIAEQIDSDLSQYDQEIKTIEEAIDGGTDG